MSATETEHIISLKSFTIGHQKGTALLSKLDLTVNKGEMVALIGRNGTGKSTLLKSMIGLLEPLEGSCFLDGRSFGEYSLPQRARKLSFVSAQPTNSSSLSVSELVGLGRMPYTGWMGRLSTEDEIMVGKALDEVQMRPFADRKLDCLSDGERQRAMIARALAQDTPLMVLDEPTAFLDLPNTFELISILSRFRDAGRSIVYSTHDLETAMQCADKMWVIHKDRILEGAPEDLGIAGLFSKLFSGSGIGFDDQTGRFQFSGTERGYIRLKGGEGVSMTWTRNALDRLGYRIEKEAEKELEVLAIEEGSRWIYRNRRETNQFESLYDLARFLIQVE